MLTHRVQPYTDTLDWAMLFGPFRAVMPTFSRRHTWLVQLFQPPSRRSYLSIFSTASCSGLDGLCEGRELETSTYPVAEIGVGTHVKFLCSLDQGGEDVH